MERRKFASGYFNVSLVDTGSDSSKRRAGNAKFPRFPQLENNNSTGGSGDVIVQLALRWCMTGRSLALLLVDDDDDAVVQRSRYE